MFEELLYLELKKYIGSDINVAVHEVLYIGKLIAVTNSILTLLVKTDSYEKETNKILIPLSKVNYVLADPKKKKKNSEVVKKEKC